MTEKTYGLINGLDSYTGQDLAQIARDTFGATDSITPAVSSHDGLPCSIKLPD